MTWLQSVMRRKTGSSAISNRRVIEGSWGKQMDVKLPQDPVPATPESATHDIETFARQAELIEERIRRIVERGLTRELIPIWKRPGWTTPAEYFLVQQLLLRLERDVDSIEQTIGAISKGSGLVGEPIP